MDKQSYLYFVFTGSQPACRDACEEVSGLAEALKAASKAPYAIIEKRDAETLGWILQSWYFSPKHPAADYKARLGD